MNNPGGETLENLSAWSKQIVEQNKQVGHRATWFARKTAGKTADQLVEVWEDLLAKPAGECAHQWTQKTGLLTVEAVVAEFGGELGFDSDIVIRAGQRFANFQALGLNPAYARDNRPTNLGVGA